MHLQQQPRGQPGFAQRRRQPHHGALDDVGRAALQRRVDRLPFGIGAARRVLVANPGYPATAAEQAGDVAVAPRFRLRPLHIRSDAGITGEIGIDITTRLARRGAELPRQAEPRNPIDDAEIDRLGAPARHRVHALHRHAEHFAGGTGMDVLAALEAFAQRGDVGHMRQQPQLDLRVVGADQQIARFGDERMPDAATLFSADRDVLQVWIGRRQPPG